MEQRHSQGYRPKLPKLALFITLSLQLCGHESVDLVWKNKGVRRDGLIIPHFVLQTTDNNQPVVSPLRGASQKLE